MQITSRLLILTVLAFNLGACSSPADPGTSSVQNDSGLRIATLDYDIGDLSDPAVRANFENTDVLITLCEHYWGRDDYASDLDELRAINPNMKILGYFRSKVVRLEWGTDTETNRYRRELYDAARPYWSYTTEGDTLFDWKNAVVYDFTNPALRRKMIDIFAKYQSTSGNRFDGIFWDYFGTSLYIAPNVTGMDGEPDMDGDGVAHWDDPDELVAFRAGQDAFVHEMQAAMGPGFVQIANGNRAARDSVFAASLDGIFYELFPNAVFSGDAKFDQALSQDRFNNLFTVRNWPRETNGGPWLILSHAKRVGSYRNEEGRLVASNPGDFNRVMALLTDATSIYYDNTGAFRAGRPRVRLGLGRPLSEVKLEGNLYVREFENGRVEMEMGSGAYPAPFDYRIIENSQVVDSIVVAK